jgi:iron only hydrogenase large subunit-like protein
LEVVEEGELELELELRFLDEELSEMLDTAGSQMIGTSHPTSCGCKLANKLKSGSSNDLWISTSCCPSLSSGISFPDWSNRGFVKLNAADA